MRERSTWMLGPLDNLFDGHDPHRVQLARADLDMVLTRLDRLADEVHDHHFEWGDVGRELVTMIDRTADLLERATYGDESWENRKARVLAENIKTRVVADA